MVRPRGRLKRAKDANVARNNLRVIVPCLGVIAVMLGLVAYSPQLYRLFCGATGLGGTTQRVNEDTAAVAKRMVTVQFDSNVEPGLPWRFAPEQRAVKVHLGEQKLVYFSAENTSDQPIVGHATFNVTPLQTGIYFNKIQCFCFTEERLDPHQKVDMPVVFFVDPAFGKDSELRDIDTITLAYTFFRSANPANASDLSRFLPDAPPDAAYGKNSSASVAPPVTRSTPTSSARCSAAWSAARPARSRATAIRRRSRARASCGRPTTSIGGSPIRRNSFPARKCRFACWSEPRAATSLPICSRKAAAGSKPQRLTDRDSSRCGRIGL